MRLRGPRWRPGAVRSSAGPPACSDSDARAVPRAVLGDVARDEAPVIVLRPHAGIGVDAVEPQRVPGDLIDETRVPEELHGCAAVQSQPGLAVALGYGRGLHAHVGLAGEPDAVSGVVLDDGAVQIQG